MDQNFLRADLLPSTVPSVALWALALVGLVAWVGIHQLIVRRGWSVERRLGILIPLGTLASWVLVQLMGRYLFLGAPWHLLFFSFLGGASIEGVIALYRRECVLLPKRSKRLLLACRLGAIVLVLFILLQPVLIGETSRTIRRRVVVLLDDSASMHFLDAYWTLPEQMEVAEALGAIKLDGGNFSSLEKELQPISLELGTFRQLAEVGSEGVDRGALSSVATLALDSMRLHGQAFATLTKAIPADLEAEELETLKRMDAYVEEQVLPSLERLVAACADQTADIKVPLVASAESVEQVRASADVLARALYMVKRAGLSEADQLAMVTASETTRAEIATKLLTQSPQGRSLLERLEAKYHVDVYRFAATAVPVPALTSAPESPETSSELTEKSALAAEREKTRVEAFRSMTDMTAALETTLRDVPFEELAGILFLTDGRHTGLAGVDAVSRRLGGARVPISSVVIGGSKAPFDFAFGDVRVSDSIFLGDKVRLNGTFVATGAEGHEATVRLMLDDETVEEQVFAVESDDFAKEFRFTHEPEDKGVLRYELAIDVLEEEAFTNNNTWAVDVSVTDDRTNVLLVDSRPRWEFRYLRNLFYGRDKSVHLQEYLVNPDRVAGVRERVLPLASADRKFGDSESGGYPVSRSEWRKFDVIIIGDLYFDELPPEQVEEIRYCVEERGALLVVIAGPQAMPHKVNNDLLRRMLPVVYHTSDKDYRNPPESEFNFRLTPSGRGHPMMQQSASVSENEQIWMSVPEMRWRFPIDGIKPGADVLAYAEPVGATDVTLAQLAVRDLQDDPEAAVRRLEELRRTQEDNALVVVQTFGQGKVVMLNTDQTWRLRYKVGDTQHHQFWGQVLRWGAGEKLRAGNSFVRLGTDKLRYTPTDSIKIYAKIVDTHFNAIDWLKPSVIVVSEAGTPQTIPLTFRKDSHGFYETTLDPIADPGVYTLVLNAPEALRLLGANFPDPLETRFLVVTAEKPAEFATVTSSWATPQMMARVSGGQVVGPSGTPYVADDFGEGNRIMHDRSEHHLWDSWLLFLAIIALLATEWIVRKRSGFA